MLRGLSLFQRRAFCEVSQTQKIKEIIEKDKVVLFMKGVPQMPACSYSQLVVEILKFYSTSPSICLRDQGIQKHRHIGAW